MFSRIHPAYINNLHTPLPRTKSHFQYKKIVQPGIGITAADSIGYRAPARYRSNPTSGVDGALWMCFLWKMSKLLQAHWHIGSQSQFTVAIPLCRYLHNVAHHSKSRHLPKCRGNRNYICHSPKNTTTFLKHRNHEVCDATVKFSKFYSLHSTCIRKT